MSKIDFDIDIDLADRSKVLEVVNHIPASIRTAQGLKKHNTGVYLQSIPVDPETGYAGIDYKEASDVGFIKVDFLNNHVYKNVRDEAHLDQLANTEPMWQLLEYPEVVETLFQLHNHVDLVQKYKPKSVGELAMLLAIQRPGKAHLQGKSWQEISETVWEPPANHEYHFKKSHAHAYAMVIIVQLNLMAEQASQFS